MRESSDPGWRSPGRTPQRFPVPEVVLLLLAGCGCGHRQAQSDEEAAVPVTVVTLTENALDGALHYSASLEATQQVDLNSRVSGSIVSITETVGIDGEERELQSGDPVSLDQVLATVDDRIYQAQVSEARSGVDGAKAALASSEKAYRRNTTLIEDNVISQAELDQSKDQYDSDKAQLARAEHSLHEAKVQLSYCSLKSPFDGVVLSCDVSVGTLVSAGVRVFSIADISSMEAMFGVPAHVLVGLKEGQVLTATTDAYPHTAFGGRITLLGVSADPHSRLFDVDLTLPNPDRRLRVGFVMGVRVPRGDGAARGLPVPLDSIVRPPDDPKGYAVFVVTDDDGTPKAGLRKVSLGNVVGNSILVTDGIQSGERVILRGANVVADGTEVRLTH